MRGQLTISAKVRTAEILALLIILAVGATALVRTLIVASRVERFAGEQFPDTLLLAQIAQGRLEADRAANAAFALAGRPSELRDDLAGDIEVAFTAVDEGMKSYESRPRTAEFRAEWATVARTIDLWREAVAHFLEVSLLAPDPADDATLVAWKAARTASRDAEVALLSYLTKVAGEVQQVRNESTSSTRIALWLIGLALVAGACGHAVAGSWVRRSIGGTVTALVGEARRLEEAVASGQLDVRGDPAAVSAEFQPIIEGLNRTLDAFVPPLRMTARHIDRIARGDIPESVSGESRGEFEALRKNLNKCSANLESSRTRLAEAHKQLLTADRLSTIGTLAAGVAHEVNNPLAAVVANLAYVAEEVPDLLEMARRHPEDAALPERARELAEALVEARAAAQRVAAIVRDLTVVSRLDPTSTTRVMLPGLLETALTLASSKLGSRTHLVREMGPAPPVMANEAQLTRVFLHLLVNAAQAIAAKPSGEGEIRVVTRTDQHGGAVVEVRDDGPGIDPAIREHLAKPFFTTRPPGAGTGLGLAVCNSIVLGLGGLLEVESEPGRGSLFRVILPAAPALTAGV
jgi:signal transduction histidine kinase